jgi:hypothetical protein
MPLEIPRISIKPPWEKQQPYVLDGYGKAQDAMNNAWGMGTYQGPYTAGLNPLQTQGWNTVGQFAQNQGLQGANSLFGAGMSNVGAVNTFGNNANSLYAQAGQNPTQQIIGNAGQYASNPYLDGQIDAASRDVMRNLTENGLTQLDSHATNTGNMNSSRTGVMQSIMERGAADRIGDISSQMRGTAYQNGLGMAQNQYNNGLNQQLNANGQLLQAGNFGADAIANGLNLGYGAGNAMAGAGTSFQTQDQNVINGQRQQFSDQQNSMLDLVGKYLSSINGNFSGGGVQIQPNNSFGNIMSGALGGMGLYNKMQGGSTPAYGEGTLGSGTYGMYGNNGTATTEMPANYASNPTYGQLGSGFSNLGASGTVGSGW